MREHRKRSHARSLEIGKAFRERHPEKIKSYRASLKRAWAIRIEDLRRRDQSAPLSDLIPKELLVSRFFRRIVISDGCWLWDGSHDLCGYGMWKVAGLFNWKVHRLVWELLRGPIPQGKQLDHLCRNTGCSNPDHLEPVTSRENTLRGTAPTSANAKKTHCKRGHPFGRAIVWPSGKVERRCDVCVKDAYRRKRELMKQ